MNLSKALQNELNPIYTENGDRAYVSSGTEFEDMVAKIAAMRNSPSQDILNLFIPAFKINPVLACQLLFYTRDIPNRGGGGLGERRVFRICYQWLIDNHIEYADNLMSLIPEYGYWKDVRELARQNYIKNDMFAFKLLCFQTQAIINGNALAAKYAIDENDSDKQFVTWSLRAIKLSSGLTERAYRKQLVAIRKGVVERQMSSQAWEKIKYEQVPSKAMKTYRNAFERHDEGRFNDYLTSVEKGEAKINAGVLNPVDVCHEYFQGKSHRVLEAQWKALPNFVDENVNALVMADVSGSMAGQPLEVAISLALYFAERNKGQFHNQFMTFSGRPELVNVTGNTLNEKFKNINRANWNVNTNFDAAFKTILDVAIKHNVPQEQMPSVLLVVSDMQFDSANGYINRGVSAFERMRNSYRAAGYQLPHVVFWNVRASKGFVAPSGQYTTLVSGYSAGVLTAIWKKINGSNLSIVDAILESGRYDAIAEALA